MRMRHPGNSNLHLHYDPVWNGYPVLAQRGPLVNEYLHGINETLWRATNEYPRVSLFLVDIRLPSRGVFREDSFMTRFLASLKAQIEADIFHKHRMGKRTYPCRMRFVWAREISPSSDRSHFHVGLLLNKDTYHVLGDFDATGGNMAARITRAVSSALAISFESARGLAHFPDESVRYLDANALDFGYQRAMVFERLSYLAKAATKHYGSHANHFGCSRV